MNGAAVVAEILKREGTEFLSCYPRNQIIEPCAALGIRPILCRQERVGVGLADGYSRIKRGKSPVACRWRGNICGRCSAPPTPTAR
jgi:thiamine pyrophosphate-dependent acetolactate synthase large subunit-like protein